MRIYFFSIASILALALVGFLSCNEAPSFSSHQNIPFQKDQSPVKLKREAIPPSFNQAEKVESLDDVIGFDGSLRLTPNDAVSLDTVIDIVRVDGVWYLNDYRMNQVFRFDEEGRFMGALYGSGQGPGEYSKASKILPWRGGLLLYDTSKATLYSYDSSGKFIQKIIFGNNYISSQSILAVKDHLVMLGFRSYANIKSKVPYQRAPYHALYRLDEGEPALITGFGQRPAGATIPYPQDMDAIHHYVLSAYAVVGDLIWVASPFRNGVDLYDSKGRWIENLPTGIECVQDQDVYDGIPQREFSQITDKKYLPRRIIYCPPYVVCSYIKGSNDERATVFSDTGTLVASNMVVGISGTRITSAFNVDGMAVSAIPLGDAPEETVEQLTGGPKGLALVRSNGYTKGDEACYLLFSSPRQAGQGP